MGETYGSPCEELGQTRKRQEPVEGLTTLGRKADESKEAEGKSEDHSDPRAAVLVDALEPAWGHTVECQGLKGTCGAKGGGVGDGDNGECDDSVHDRGKDLDVCLLEGTHKGRITRVGARGHREKWVAGGDDQAEDEK